MSIPKHILNLRLIAVALLLLDTSASASEVWAWGWTKILPRPVKSLGGGTTMAIAVLDDGRVVSWGSNINSRHVPPLDMGPARKAVGNHKCIVALLEDGTVRVWGDTTSSFQPPRGLDRVTDIAAAQNHFLALRDDGTVVAWGSNTFGESNVPPSVQDIQAIATSGRHALALTRSGTVITWGDTAQGLSRIPLFESKVVSIAAAGYNSMAVLEDGRVVGWGRTDGLVYNLVPVPDSATDAKAVHANGNFALVEKRDGSVFAWGYRENGKLDVPVDAKNLHGLALGDQLAMGFREDGSVISWGHQYKGLAVPLFWFAPPLGEVKQISAGSASLLALRTDGTVRGAGFKNDPILRIPADLDRVTAIATGFQFALALRSDSSIRAWGDTTLACTKVPEGLGHVVNIHAGGHQCAAVLADGRVVGWGDSTASLDSLVARAGPPYKISLGDKFQLVLDSSGKVSAAGSNLFGETRIPVNTAPVVDLAAGAIIGMTRDAQDTVKIFGRIGPYSQRVPGVKQIAAGAVHALALTNEGTIIGWGENYWGQATAPKETAFLEQISTGDYFTAAIVKSSAPVSTSPRQSSSLFPLPQGTYQVALQRVNGERFWSGPARWNGTRWELPSEIRGLGVIRILGESYRSRRPQLVSTGR